MSVTLPASIESLATASYYLFDEVNEFPESFSMTYGHVHLRNTDLMPSKSERQPLPNMRFSTPSARWNALTSRDPAASKAFIYAVRTTKIYCRPDCRARLARRANVSFYDTAAQAEADGYRACKRCKPDRTFKVKAQDHTTLHADSSDSTARSQSDDSEAQQELTDPDDVRSNIQHAVRLVRQSALQGSPLTLSQLSKEVGLSKWHLQRVFKRLQGVTPREMAEAVQSYETVQSSSTGTYEDSPVSGAGSGHASLSDEFIFDNSLTSIPEPSLSILSTPSTENALTPTAWSEDANYDPTIFMVDDPGNMEVEVEDLLMDLFPELYSGHGWDSSANKVNFGYM